MASEKEINQFKDLIWRWIDQDRAKRLIIEAREWVPTPPEWLAQRALREWEEFIWWKFVWWVDVEEGTLWQKLKERWEWLIETITTKQEIFSPELRAWVTDLINKTIWKTEWWKKTLEAIDVFWQLINKMPWTEFIKEKIEDKIDSTLKTAWVIKDAAWAVNDVIWEWINEVLEFTWLDKQIEKWVKAISETETWKEVFTALEKWKQAFELIKKLAPWLATVWEAWLEVWELTWLWKAWKVWKETLETGIKKLPTPSLKSQWLAESLLDTTFKFKPSQKKRFRKPNIWGWKTPSEYLLEKWIITDSSTPEDVVKWLENLNKTSKNTVDSSLSSIPDLFTENKSTDKILSVLLKETSDTPWLEDVVNRLNELGAKSTRWEWLTLTEINEVKRSSDDILHLFWVTWNIREWTLKKWLVNLRDDVKTFIENEAGKRWVTNIKDLNKDTQLSNELLKMIDDNLEAWASTRLIWLTDFFVAWIWTAWWDLWIWIWAVALKKLAESDRFKIALAKRFAELPSDKVTEIAWKVQTWAPLTWIEKLLIWWAIIKAQSDIWEQENLPSNIQIQW